MGIIWGSTIGLIKGYTRSLDYSSYKENGKNGQEREKYDLGSRL